MTKRKPVKDWTFTDTEKRTIQKAMALYAGYATNNEKSALATVLSILKKIL